MHRRFKRYAAPALMMLTAAAVAGPAGAGVTGKTPVRLITTGDLIGWTVTTEEGGRVGTLEYVAIDLDEGRVSQLVIDTPGGEPADAEAPPHGAAGGRPGESLLIVPWTAARLAPASEVAVIAATGRQIAAAPRVQRRELNRLSQPALASYVIDYWNPSSDIAALESERSARKRTGASGRDAGSGQIRPDAPMQPEPGAITPDRPADDGRAGAGRPVALIGEEVVAEVVPPVFQLGENLEGAAVTDRGGRTVGRIERIMIDTATGDAAFVVIEAAAGAAPVPLQTLEWTAKGTTMFTADRAALRPDPALTNEPGAVSRTQLAELYQRFDVEPYWERTGAGGATDHNSTETRR